MDVTDIKTKEAEHRQLLGARPPRQREILSLSSSKISSEPSSVHLHVEGKHTKQNNEARTHANDVINVMNVAFEAAADINKLVESLNGIAQQADSEQLPEERRAALETEGNQLVEEIKAKANVASHGIRPLAGGEIRLEVEQRLGTGLEVLLPGGASDAFGIGTVQFSDKEHIIRVRTAIAEAQSQVEKLSAAIVKAKSTVEDTVTALDVALQNSEASQASIRDVDEALSLASNMKTGIGEKPGNALGSAGKLNSEMLDLLKS